MSEDEYIRIMNEGRELTIKELISEFILKLSYIESHRFVNGYPVFEKLLNLMNEYEEKLK